MSNRTPRSRFLSGMSQGRTIYFRAHWCPEWAERTIVKKRSNDLAISHPSKPGVSSWLQFPKAAEVHEPTPGHFIIADEAGGVSVDSKYALHYWLGEGRPPEELTR